MNRSRCVRVARAQRARHFTAIVGLLVLSLARNEVALAAAPREDAPPTEPTFSPHPLLAVTTDTAEEQPSLVPKLASGFLAVNGSAQSVPSALARNRADYAVSGAVGVAAAGTPYERWDYLAFVTASAGADAVKGTSGSIAPEQITIQWKPIPALSLLLGYQRIPFSAAQGTAITSSMFPTRPEPTDLFQGGADAGFLSGYEALAGRMKIKLGIFDGLSLRLTVPGHTTNGPVLSAWMELSPLGVMKPIEADFGDSPFRIAVGGGIVYRNATAYDATGYRGLDVQDVRFSASLRLAFRGFFLQGEYLHALRTDDLSGRPSLARGTYGEASYYVPVKRKIGIAPLTRVGWSVRDEGFFPLHVITGHVGLAVYPRGDLAEPGAVRLIVEYQSERHLEEAETAYGGLASVLYRF